MTQERIPGLGVRIAAARDAAGLTQVELAALAGLRQAELSKIERGKRNASAATVAALARALGVTSDSLLLAPAKPKRGRPGRKP
jgi:transcriptional regulator with XRE-family HTH domain